MRLSDYYSTIGVEIGTLMDINRELTVGDLSLDQMIEASTGVKRAMLREAEGSTKKHGLLRSEIEGSRKENPRDVSKWKGDLVNFYGGENPVGAVKPGKEAATDYKLSHYKKCKCVQCEGNGRSPRNDSGRSPNVHDMLPVILDGNRNVAVKITYSKKGGLQRYTPWTLDHICRPLEYLFSQKYGRFGLELFGTILFRSSLNMDHNNTGGFWRMEVPNDSLKLIERCLPEKKMHFLEGDEKVSFSVSSLFYFFDILGINEDIKVHAKGRVSDFMEPVTWDRHDRGGVPEKLVLNGRTNTLLTYCEMISIMLSRSSVGSGMIGYQRGFGMYPMQISRMFDVFPLLSPNFSEILEMDVNGGLDWLHGPF